MTDGWNNLVTYRGEFIALEISSNIPSQILNVPRFLEEVQRRLSDGARREAEIVERALKRVTATWSEENKPQFTIRSGGSGDLYYVEVSTDSAVFKWLNFGTGVRYATMTPDFQPKTQVRVIGSRRGRGGKAFTNKNYPKAGIQAREWVDEVAKRRAPNYHRNMDRIFKRVLKKYWAKDI